ncbi:MAG: DNA polymerase III subunit alpha [Kiritimatiellae bacterium]|nr:DNA polymerase III subunit alpha [Kiritimatiellia bacterium]
MENYVPLDVQSSYSIGKSICTIPNLVRKARELGVPTLALTDDGFMFGAKEFYNECRRLGGSYGDLPPIKPVIGLSIDVSENGVRHTIRLLAKNADGYHNLVRIASEGARFEKTADHSVDFQTVGKWHDGLICLTEETDAKFVERCLALFGEDFAFEATGDDCDFSAWPSVMVCAANPVRQLEAGDAEALDAWRAICSRRMVDELAPLAGDMPRHLMSPDEMATRFCKHPEWLENTVKLAERIETFDLDRPPAICAFPFPEGFADALDYLRHRVMEGAKTRWGDPLPEDAAARLDYELSVLGRRCDVGCDAASYLLIVADYVEAARRMGVAVGPGRGGTCGSAAAYALGITDVDPLKYGLLFERFLNPDKGNLPDIDIDFDEEGVAKVLGYLAGKYGEDHVARIATFTVTARKSGYVRSVGTHACGIVISPEAMTDLAPVMHMDNGPIPLVTQYDGRHLEDIGLVKFDLLDLKALSDQKRRMELIEEKTGGKVDLAEIPDDDGETLAVFANGDTADIFQFGCDGIRKVLRKLKPSRFSNIAALNALFHPGMMDLLPAFIRRKNGEEPVSYDHPLMVDVLEETYGMLVYQEQVMLLAQRLAGFTPGESDGLRKAFGKKLRQRVGEYRDKFVAGCLANPEFRIEGWRDEAAARTLAEKVFGDCGRVALYAFCKSHAVCYALLAYRSAYLQAHWPEEFEKVLRNNCALRP